jgi:23S rRNA G2445 N2-methylase RlmL
LCSDSDEKILEIAKTNAEQAWVDDTISFTKHDILSPLLPYELNDLTIVSNPPYGKRLTGSDLDNIYTQLINHIQNSNWGWFITSYKDCERNLPKEWRKKKLFNGADEVMFYFR